jgi:hypothetical protein
LQCNAGYPDKLKRYVLTKSSFCQVRYYDGNSQTIKHITGQTDKLEAIKSAKSFYEQIILNSLHGLR